MQRIKMAVARYDFEFEKMRSIKRATMFNMWKLAMVLTKVWYAKFIKFPIIRIVENTVLLVVQEIDLIFFCEQKKKER